MPTTITIVSRAEFEDDNGRKAGWPTLPVGNHTHLCESGARVQDSPRADAPDRLIDPPSNSLERLKARRHYHKTRLERLVDTFRKMKGALLGHKNPLVWTDQLCQQLQFEPTNYPNGPVEEEKDLIRLKEECWRHEDAICEIEADIATHPETIAEQRRREERERYDEMIRESDRQRRARIEAITLDRDGTNGAADDLVE